MKQLFDLVNIWADFTGIILDLSPPLQSPIGEVLCTFVRQIAFQTKFFKRKYKLQKLEEGDLRTLDEFSKLKSQISILRQSWNV